MNLKIRMQRNGRKNRPMYTIVIAESSKPRDGKFVHKIGSYDPFSKKTIVNHAIYTKYINYGAQPSARVKKIVAQQNDA